jgi:ethanolamine utilization protein EutQ (cupin superfamily)
MTEEEEPMPRLIGSAKTVDAVGNKHKVCDEYVGLINTGDENVSITRMHSPSGWEGMGHYSDFHEYAVVLKGRLHVEHTDGTMDVEIGQAVHIKPREEVIFSTPGEEGCEYLTVCVPAYSRAAVHFLK